VTLFGFAMKLAPLMPDYRFVFRCHPALPFERVRSHLGLEKETLPGNIEVSISKEICDDFNRASCVLYRGSSAVFYAILKGLKPFYLQNGGEDIIDPIFKLNAWRESVDSPESFATRARVFETTPMQQLHIPFQAAVKYAREYMMPVGQESIAHFLKTLS